MTTDKHEDGTMSEDSGHPPHLYYPPRIPRREIDWEKVDMRWMVDHSENQSRLSRFLWAITDYLDRRKLRKHKAQVNRLAEDAKHWDRDRRRD